MFYVSDKFSSGEIWCKWQGQREGGKSRSSGDFLTHKSNIFFLSKFMSKHLNQHSRTKSSSSSSVRWVCDWLQAQGDLRQGAMILPRQSDGNHCEPYKWLKHRGKDMPSYANKSIFLAWDQYIPKEWTMYCYIFPLVHTVLLNGCP